jgi:hypothetical protein
MRLLALWHWLTHGVRDAMIERGKGEVYLRCTRCGLRSVGWQTGPLKVHPPLAGDPERFRLQGPPSVAVPRSEVLFGPDVDPFEREAKTGKMTVH